MDKSYHKALVIFIDILGSQNRQDFDILYHVNSIFHNQLEKNQHQDKSHTVYERHIYTFSDCSYIIYDYKEGVDELRKDIQNLMTVALYNTQTLIQEFLFNGFICRGGVAYGDVYYEKTRSLLFGPAVNLAYHLESKVAKYPRIAVDDFVAEKIISYHQQRLKDMPSKEQREFMKSVNGDIILQDRDNCYYFNYLCSVKQGHDYYRGKELLQRLRNLIDNEVRIQQNNPIKAEAQKILEKYQWLSNYIDESIPLQNTGSTVMYYNFQ